MKQKQEKVQIDANKAGNPSPKTKAEMKALLEVYAEQNPVKWERKKEGLLKKLEAMPE